ncbi:NAD(P)/FAD-dependent oxidoreductase [Paenibacillus sp. J5C_2022]|uniref:NAD(P)/FAD-dependent oxidoreductase n=1 Tax=Paenibacillus sp. J5C2022 TaxID=2977129 RepID=UPI0021D17CA1|nr:NAD(P)/FAD-dependent oxidoreductase [Paenibacillus sp. J5C2022]MCU6707423.1 NAD(P)/FAD-dependent oxidoreductase [Paenibacillus sp. J5C2022]
MLYDCVIIGGGPAGLNAALVLGRARRGVAIVDNNQPRNAVTRSSHGFITRDGVTPGEFRRIAYEEVLHYPTVEHIQQEAVAAVKTDEGFEIEVGTGQVLRSRKLLLSSGLKEILPAIEGLLPLYGRSLFNCPYCDGWELRDRALVVVSEQPTAFHTAKLLLNWSKDIIVCTNGNPVLSEEEARLLQARSIPVIEKPIAEFIGSDGQLQGLRFSDGAFLARTGGFVVPKLIQSSSIGEELGCELTENGEIRTDASGKTSVPGFYSAGDAIAMRSAQLIMAAASGSRAAISINMELTEEDFTNQ